MRSFLGVGKYHPITALQGDMGWAPCVYRHYFEILKWWGKIRSYTDNRLTKQVFLWSMDMAERGYKAG